MRERNERVYGARSPNTDKAASIASMDKIRRMIATYNAKLFINHDKAQTNKLKMLPAFYD
jgi:N-acyl homoserine lactone hydrolase